MELELLTKAAVALSAVVAAATFILSVRDRTKSQRKAEIREWQIVAIHKLFAKSPDEWLPFDKIMQMYRSEASAFPRQNIAKEELSEEALRRIITEMLKNHLIDQRLGDQYRLYTKAFAEESLGNGDPFLRMMKDSFDGFFTDMATRSENRPAADMLGGLNDLLVERAQTDFNIGEKSVNIVADDPNKYSVSDLVLRVSRELKLEHETVRVRILGLLRDGLISEVDGRLRVH